MQKLGCSMSVIMNLCTINSRNGIGESSKEFHTHTHKKKKEEKKKRKKKKKKKKKEIHETK